MFTNNSHLNNSNNGDFCYLFVLAVIDVTAGVIGTVANILILIIVRRHTSIHTSIHTTVNFLLTNLAVSDIWSVLSLIAFSTLEQFIDWKALGIAAFRLYGTFVETLLGVVLSSSIITLALLSIQQYQSLVCPMTTALRIKDRNTKYVTIIVRMLSFLLTVPTIVLSPTTDRSLVLNDHNAFILKYFPLGIKSMLLTCLYLCWWLSSVTREYFTAYTSARQSSVRTHIQMGKTTWSRNLSKPVC